MHKTSIAIIGILLLGLAFAAYNLQTKGNLGGGVKERSCAVNTVTAVAVGADLTTTVLPAYSNRSWARVGVASAETEPIFVSFDEGAAATVSNGVILTATSTTYIDFGLNADFPYTGAVTAITNTASTTLMITECRY